MKVTFEDINRRLCRLTNKFAIPFVSVQETQLYTSNHVFCKNNAINAIRHWENLSENSNDAFEKALDVFDEICANANESTIRDSCEFLIENVDKVRDQIQLANSLKYRMSTMKRKVHTKIARQHNLSTSKVQDSIDSINSSLNGNSNDNNIANTTGVTQTTGNNDDNSDTNDNNVAQECYKAIYNKCIAVKECDRIVKNYANISKRFNLDKIISNVQHEGDLYQACNEIAACIDTYNESFKNKYNSALETAVYAFDKHYMNYPKGKIVEAITDYFLFTGSLKEDQVKDVKSVIEISVLFDRNDFDCLSWMLPNKINITESNNKVSVEDYGVEYKYLTEEDMIKDAKNKIKSFNKDLKDSTKKLIKDAKTGNPEEHENDNIKQMIDDFRSKCLKNKDEKPNISALKNLITGIFAKSPYQIVNDMPNMFSLIRVVFVFSALAINPILGVVTLITDQFISIGLSRKQMEKVIKAYNNEIESVNNKIEKTKDDKTKKNLNAYLEELKKDLKKLEDYERNVYSDEENDERDAAKWSSDDSDFNFDDSEFDIDFNEMASVICISNFMASISENLIDTNVDGIIYNNIFKLDNDSIDALTDFSITVPVILEKDKLTESLIDYRNRLRETAKTTKDYIRIDCLNENIYKLNNSGSSYNTSNSTRDAMLYLACLNEIVKINSENYIMEMDFTNTIKLAINNLKRSAVKLSDKEKQASNSIDVAANNVSKSIEKSMMNGNREAVIRGNMIPSLSKCIKIALTFGIGWAISPAIAVIGAVGAFACSKHLQKKERQLILDDIEVELKMCERYLKDAEDKNDMKKIRQLETIKRSLERQRQRIKYKMIVVYNQRVPDPESDQ